MKVEKFLKTMHLESIKNIGVHSGLRSHKTSITKAVIDRLTCWSPVKTKKTITERPYQLLDFFCGSGGMSLGFSALSGIAPFFRIIGGCDINPDAARTYSQNFGVPVAETDIRELASDKRALRRFLSGTNGYDSDTPLVVIGCAPCQGFSSHRKKVWDQEDGRNTLVSDFAKVATILKPVCVVMENVPELLSVKYWNNFESARDILRNAGYVVRQAIYNAASFGVPQERFRAVVIAMRHDFLLPEPIFGPKDYRTVRQAIGHLPMVEPGKEHPLDKMHRSAGHRPETIDVIRAVPKNGGSRPPGVGPKCLDRVRGYYDVYGRLFWDSPAITITHYARNPASGRYVHPEQDRGLTMREAALLQSFPAGFEFTGTFDAVFKQIGEAVPPGLACGVAANVVVELLSPPPDEREKHASIPAITKPVSSSYSSVIAGIKTRRHAA